MKPLPTLSGTQYPGDIPWGMNVATNRGFGVAAVCARRRRRHHRVQQRQGKRRPVPRKKVRRGMCFFAMNMVSSFAAQRAAVCRATSAPLMLFWNGALLTMLSTSVEKR